MFHLRPAAGRIGRQPLGPIGMGAGEHGEPGGRLLASELSASDVVPLLMRRSPKVELDGLAR